MSVSISPFNGQPAVSTSCNGARHGIVIHDA